jgi:membrane protein required for colicin V production
VGPLLGFAVVFGGVQLAFFALARLVESLVGAMRLTAVNRMAGGLLGGFKAALLLSVLFVLMARAELPGPEARQQSQLYEPVTQVLPRTWAAAAEHTSQLGRLPAPLGGPGPTTAEGPDQEKGP